MDVLPSARSLLGTTVTSMRLLGNDHGRARSAMSVAPRHHRRGEESAAGTQAILAFLAVPSCDGLLLSARVRAWLECATPVRIRPRWHAPQSASAMLSIPLFSQVCVYLFISSGRDVFARVFGCARLHARAATATAVQNFDYLQILVTCSAVAYLNGLLSRDERRRRTGTDRGRELRLPSARRGPRRRLPARNYSPAGLYRNSGRRGVGRAAPAGRTGASRDAPTAERGRTSDGRRDRGRLSRPVENASTSQADKLTVCHARTGTRGRAARTRPHCSTSTVRRAPSRHFASLSL